MAKKENLQFKRTIKAPAAEVFLALTNPTALREWFSDVAQIEPRQGGRIYFAWNQGYYAAGEITQFNPGKKLGFTWTGRGEPDTTQVDITVATKKDASTVTVLHSGVRTGKKWKEMVAAITRGWELGLENLQSVLETGRDERFTRRPMLGVTGLEELTPEMAAQLNLPVQQGVRIDGTAPGMGAEAAGLQKDDVLVRLGDHKISSWPTLASALQAHRAGDKVPVGYYRGAEKKRIILELSQRQLQAVPPTAAELASAARKMYDEADAKVAKALEGVGDDEGKFSPAPGEWSAREVLAHLVVNERDTHAWIAELVAGDERAYSSAGGNSQIRTQATADAFGGAAALFDELKRNEAETVGMLAALPDDFVNRKRSYWRLANTTLQTADHTREHLRQVEAAVAAGRQPH